LNLFCRQNDKKRLQEEASTHKRRVRSLARIRIAVAVSAVLTVWALRDKLPAFGRETIYKALSEAPLEASGKLLTGLGKLIAIPLALATDTEAGTLENAGFGLLGRWSLSR
jgi:hypothetical protein